MKLSSSLFMLIGASVALAKQSAEIARRQAHIPRALVVDVCASVDLDIEVAALLPGAKAIVIGHIDICLCLSVVADFVASDSTCKSAAQHIGNDGVANLLTNHIQNAASKKQCTYPDHGCAASTCEPSNPCGSWTCTDGYTKSGSDCVCPPPYAECNGKCGYFPHGCGSATPKRRRERRAPTCEAGKTLCGVPSKPANDRAYDCVNTASNRESCGGCVTKSPFSTLAASAPVGKDCTAIPHVARVDCANSACVVSACKDGFAVSAAKDACVPA